MIALPGVAIHSKIYESSASLVHRGINPKTGVVKIIDFGIASRFSRTNPTFIIVMHYLYNSLARLATYSESSDRVKSEILTKVASSQEKMKQWADYAPMNYLHKYHLVEAEKARVLGRLLEG